MEIRLRKKPKGPIIIEGFPGIGLIGTITTEYLIKHLNAKSIGYIWSENLPPIAAIHDSKVVQPLEVFYAQKENIVILHVLSDIRGMEWEIADTLIKLYQMLDAKEIVSLEGILGSSPTPNVYFFSTNPKKFTCTGVNITPLKEGIIMGVTAAVLLKNKGINASGIFVETHSKLPDSIAAAKIIEVLDCYLGLKIDYKPLLKMAAEFEEKLKSIIEQSKKALEHKKERDKGRELSYFG